MEESKSEEKISAVVTSTSRNLITFPEFGSDVRSCEPEFLSETYKVLLQPQHVKTEGLFRRSPDEQMYYDVLTNLLSGKKIDIVGVAEQENGIHVLTKLIKTYFRSLPNPIIPRDFYDLLLMSLRVEDVKLKEKILKEILGNLPEANRKIMVSLLRFMKRVSDVKENKMNVQNLALCISPNLFCNGVFKKTLNFKMDTMIVGFMMEHIDEISKENEKSEKKNPQELYEELKKKFRINYDLESERKKYFNRKSEHQEKMEMKTSQKGALVDNIKNLMGEEIHEVISKVMEFMKEECKKLENFTTEPIYRIEKLGGTLCDCFKDENLSKHFEKSEELLVEFKNYAEKIKNEKLDFCEGCCSFFVKLFLKKIKNDIIEKKKKFRENMEVEFENFRKNIPESFFTGIKKIFTIKERFDSIIQRLKLIAFRKETQTLKNRISGIMNTRFDSIEEILEFVNLAKEILEEIKKVVDELEKLLDEIDSIKDELMEIFVDSHPFLEFSKLIKHFIEFEKNAENELMDLFSPPAIVQCCFSVKSEQIERIKNEMRKITEVIRTIDTEKLEAVMIEIDSFMNSFKEKIEKIDDIKKRIKEFTESVDEHYEHALKASNKTKVLNDNKELLKEVPKLKENINKVKNKIKNFLKI